MRPSEDEEVFPLVAQESEALRSMFALHAHHLDRSPVLAHWTAAGIATSIGCTLAAARGAFVALTQPAGARFKTFAMVSRSAAPLYVIPFVLGSQLDCYEARWEREGHKKSEWSGAAADLG